MDKKSPAVTGISKHGKSSERSLFFKNKAANLYLEDGSVFKGAAPPGQSGSWFGEVVFNTGMTGYVESLTDPSYAGQILVFTYPMIGNYGVQKAHQESRKIQVSGIVVSELSRNYSHSAADTSLLQWLHSQDIPLLEGVDTRELTKSLRVRGTMMGAISDKPVDLKKYRPLVAPDATDKPLTYNRQQSKKVILVDCGAKGNILRSLKKLPIQIKLVPRSYDYTLEGYDAVMLSNGPGDPTDYAETIAIIRKALAIGKPVFGICLGSQLMALAAGAQTYKLTFGHRGHNQPCMDTDNQKCFITSQNHSYAIDDKSLPPEWEVSFRNLNDGSVEGILHKTKPFFSVQFHPEACPGPTDTQWLFDKFYKLTCEFGR